MSEETITEQNTSLPLGDDPTQPQRPSETTLLEANLYGERIAGRYLLLEAIGAGGMGQVYRAEHQATGGVVAVKLIHSELLTSPTAAQRFELEARHTASLNHPNVVKVFDCGRDGERLYLAMEYVPGRPLTELILDQGPLPWQRVVALTRQLLVALGHAHESEHRLIHRDVKPDNILVMDRLGQDDFVKVVDFGIAHALATASDTDHFAGSPQTMAPEQWQRSGRISPATDLYAVGCVTYTMLAGRQPFDHDSIGQMMIQHLMHAPPPLSEYARVNTPPPLIDWVRWLMHKPPERRPTSARQALESLEALAHGNPSPFLTSGANPIAQPPASPERGALPTFMGHFFGREPLMERLDTLLIRDHGRQVTIHGQGGLGKSRLAVEWGRQRREAFGGEVFFAALSEARTVEDICGEVARVLDVPLGQGDPVELLGHALHGHGRTLMILDNFEQVTHHAADTLHRWYRLAPEAVFVVTCRHSLGLDVEQVLHITPLELPKEGEHDADTLALNGAVALFLDRARRVRPDLRWTDAAAADVAQLVRELDGLPLAIELAAARTRALSPKQLVERLDQRFRLLRSHTHHQGRQATLEATLAWSWDLLETWERAALVQCSVFQGPFALEAAEAVVDLSDMDDDPWVVDALEALLDKSLLHTTSRDRYDMYTAIRAYASQQEIPDLTPIPSARSRHMRFFARYGRPAFLNPLDSGRSPMDELGESLENLRGALSWALEHESMEEATCCALALGQYLVRRGPFQQGLDLLEQVLEHDRLSNDQRGALLCLLGHLAEQSGQLDRAVETFRAALDLPEDTHRGHALFKLGFAQLLQGNPDKAHQSMQQALAHARQHGDTRLEAAVLARLGAVHSRRRDNALALDAFETS
ncbi:MAG: protein kinase, partial [Myxococcota bacterium]